MLILMCLCSCYKRVGGSRSGSSASAVTDGAEQCSETAGTLSIRIATPAYFLDGTVLETPGVALRLADALLTLGAHWQSGNADIAAELPAGLAAGQYDVIVSRANGDSETLTKALTIRLPPQVTGLSTAALCDDGAAQALRITGTNLQGATVTLGSAGVQTATVSADGTTIDLAPRLGAGSYPVNIDTGLGCTAHVATPLLVVGKPVVSAVAVGPRAVSLGEDFAPLIAQSALASAAITVRLTGTNLVSGALVQVGGVTGTVKNTTGTVLDAQFAVGAIAAGDFHASVHIGSCAVDSPGFSVVAGPLTPLRANPAVVALPQAFVDLSGSFASAIHGPAFFIDTDPDPIGMELHALTYEAKLDRDGTAYRVSVGDVPSAGTYDVISVARDTQNAWQSGVGQALLQVAQSAPPRIVFREQEWLAHSASQIVDVYGCRFAGTQFALLDAAGEVVQTVTPTVSALASARPWAANKFVCGPNDPAVDFAELAFAGRDPGVYRLRATSAAGTHDDLYPLVVYGDAPVPSLVATDPRGLTTARTSASAARGFDATGRSFVYVFGGASDVQLSPELSTSIEQSYELTAVADDGTLVGAGAKLTANARPIEHELPLPADQCPTLADTEAVPATFGASPVFDGPNFYLVGGKSGTSAPFYSSAIRKGAIVSAAHEASFTSAAAGPAGTVPSGFHYLVANVIYPEGDAAPYRELVTPPVGVYLAHDGSINATLTIPCGTPAKVPPGTGACAAQGADATYTGCPLLTIAMSPATTALFDESTALPVLEPPTNGAWTITQGCPSACVGTFTAQITIASDSAVAGAQIGQAGMLQVLVNDAQALGKAVTGAIVGVTRHLDTRALFVLGGYSGAFEKSATVFALTDEAAVGTVNAQPALAAAVAFSTPATELTPIGTLVRASGGVQASQAPARVVSGGGLLGTFSESAAAAPTYATGAALAGSRLFSLGGFEAGTNNGTTDNSGLSLLHDDISALDASGSFHTVAHLPLPRAAAATVQVPPYVYVLGGTVCGSSDCSAFSDESAFVPSGSCEVLSLAP